MHDANRKPSIEDLLSTVQKLEDFAKSYSTYRTLGVIDLNAAHSRMSNRALSMMGSMLDDKGASGRAGKRHHSGIAQIEEIERLAIQLARQLFDVEFVELRPPTGALSNMVATQAFAGIQDVIMAVPTNVSGHWTYGKGGYPDHAGITIIDVPYNSNSLQVDIHNLATVARMARPKLIVIGTSLCLFPNPVQEIRAIADEVSALVVYDASHVLGLIAGGEFQDPLREGAHLITGSTQKTFPGPTGGLILTNDRELAEVVTDAADDFFSNYLNSRIAALAITFAEMIAFGKQYAQSIVQNARALAMALDTEGFNLFAQAHGPTCSHQVIIDTSSLGRSTDLAARLEECGLICSHMMLPNDFTHGDSYPTALRFGVSDVTRRGMTPEEMKEIAGMISRALLSDEPSLRIEQDARNLVLEFQQTLFCF